MNNQKTHTESIRILIVENEVIIAEDINESLKLLGYDQNDIAYNDLEASRLNAINNYDLILMDIRLDGSKQDGIQLANTIGGDAPIVFCTNHTDQETIRRILNTPHLSYVLKPFQMDKIKDIIEAVLMKTTN